jgi:protein-tyrosine phosphatase
LRARGIALRHCSGGVGRAAVVAARSVVAGEGGAAVRVEKENWRRNRDGTGV